mmetsp:Transcript_16182/g.32797  ORF Transcript_16182/g.32797 Transcript_16182/m.32797 type:complete len:248 (-) Transcript_16182:282-1025(-)
MRSAAFEGILSFLVMYRSIFFDLVFPFFNLFMFFLKSLCFFLSNFKGASFFFPPPPPIGGSVDAKRLEPFFRKSCLCLGSSVFLCSGSLLRLASTGEALPSCGILLIAFEDDSTSHGRSSTSKLSSSKAGFWKNTGRFLRAELGSMIFFEPVRFATRFMSLAASSIVCVFDDASSSPFPAPFFWFSSSCLVLDVVALVGLCSGVARNPGAARPGEFSALWAGLPATIFCFGRTSSRLRLGIDSTMSC